MQILDANDLRNAMNQLLVQILDDVMIYVEHQILVKLLDQKHQRVESSEKQFASLPEELLHAQIKLLELKAKVEEPHAVILKSLIDYNAAKLAKLEKQEEVVAQGFAFQWLKVEYVELVHVLLVSLWDREEYSLQCLQKHHSTAFLHIQLGQLLDQLTEEGRVSSQNNVFVNFQMLEDIFPCEEMSQYYDL